MVLHATALEGERVMNRRKFRRQVAEQIKTLKAWLKTGEKSQNDFDKQFNMSAKIPFTRRGMKGDDYIIPCFNGDMVQQEYLCILQFMIGENMVKRSNRKGVVYYSTKPME